MSTTNARTSISDFTAREISFSKSKRGAIFLNITDRCDIMLGHSSSTTEELAEEIRALRALSDTADRLAGQLEARMRKTSADQADVAS